jgi:hypothetical protein
MELLEDGRLHIVASTGAAQLGRDALAACALGTLKRQAGASPQQVKAQVLGCAD